MYGGENMETKGWLFLAGLGGLVVAKNPPLQAWLGKLSEINPLLLALHGSTLGGQEQWVNFRSFSRRAVLTWFHSLPITPQLLQQSLRLVPSSEFPDVGPQPKQHDLEVVDG